MFNHSKKPFNNKAFWLPLVLSAALVSACSDSGDSDPQSQASEPTFFNLNIPDSMTGGTVATSQALVRAAAQNADVPCAYIGVEDDDPFRNGYQMSKFMVSAIATWTCIADVLIEVADAVPVEHGIIHQTDNDTMAPNYDVDDPTHFSITDDSETQTTIRMYYGYDREAPPFYGEDPQFYISWNEDEMGDIQGRMIIDGAAIDAENNNPEDPVMMRMDFNMNADEKVADMFLRFDTGNEWAEGMRILVTKDLTVPRYAQVFTAQGKFELKAQFVPVPDVNELPVLDMYSVSDAVGNGGTVANMVDFTLPLVVNAENNNHLGNYLLTKEDKYVFDADGDPDWIYKTFASSTFQGGRTTLATGGTIDRPSLDMISGYLWPQQPNYFESNCINIDDDCTDLFNAIFDFDSQNWDHEPNFGEDPMDWRSDAIATLVPLPSVYPNGMDWTGAFDYIFTPQL